jgi:hypothetical protein
MREVALTDCPACKSAGPSGVFSPAMPADKSYEDKVIRLADLLDQQQAPPKLEGFAFYGCQINGPAVVYPVGSTEFDGCRFDGDPDSLFIDIPAGPVKIGIIGVEDCTFTNCVISGVGFAGTPKQGEAFRKALARQP